MAQIGLVGLAVMGANLALNIESRGYSVAVYNRTYAATEKFMSIYGEGRKLEAAKTPEELIAKIDKPRTIIMMIKAGAPVDALIDTLIPLLDKGDTLIDGGNANFHDTVRRSKKMAEHGLMYIGMGVSGGEEGALHGPSLMPGGDYKAWENVGQLLMDISAKAPNGEPCCAYLGTDGAGHFTKTVHNGIEYGDMELLCETYQFMRNATDMTCDQMGDVFAKWNEGMLGGYLTTITSEILKFKENGEALVPRILDVAGQKGTGKWTVIEALNVGVPSTVVGEALFSRFLTTKKAERVEASKIFDGPEAMENVDAAFVEKLGEALLAAKIILYAQGCAILIDCTKEYGWKMHIPTIARLWRGGCIIRSNMLEDIVEAFETNPDLPNMMIAPKFREILKKNIPSLREVVAEGAKRGIALPAMASALAYFDGYRCAKLPANLLQAQRDYFGAHTYLLEDDQESGPRHTNWTGEGGEISSGVYNV
ncbi:decarboxylating NADP(+)-dependent phosphogluconate dehydrogenase [Christensenellaceae bacterium NSJ-63]|uniref:6-phosphogluconate dehydrogenase, decarboxylating n=1 Tax=Guopingia tenuis TaxID=2763656 RepID=A0A926DJ24_9FIRM|nr:decarboxylating NADP(+)-dependent phosphogluconate dehydrogenase [Guopingia tenuis]MBC8538766.1 decarboxylating NADP(+)-dependent phosphogluconate dehydrogenase [Guopingia tenuis]